MDANEIERLYQYNGALFCAWACLKSLLGNRIIPKAHMEQAQQALSKYYEVNDWPLGYDLAAALEENERRNGRSI